MDPTPDPQGLTWLPVDATPEAAAIRALVLMLIIVASGLTARAAWGQLERWRAGAGGAARRAIGRPAADPWATGDWACSRCRSVNPRSLEHCSGCRGPRADVEIPVPAIEPEPDMIPAVIAAGVGSTVVLEHNDAAHLEGLTGHWRLRVDGVIVGSAARRDGALALLRAVEGGDAVLFDPRGMGYGLYPLQALIGAFEGPRLPYAGRCPEATAR